MIGLYGEDAKKSHLMHIQQEKLFKTFANEHLQEYLSLSPNVRVPFGPRDVVFGPYSMYPYLKDDQRYPTMELFELYVRHEVARLMPVTVRLAGVLSRMPAEFNALFDEFDPNRPAGDAPYSILVDSENTLRRANRRLAALEEDWLINLFAYTQNHFYISTAQENFPGIDSSIPEDIYLQYRYHADNFITLLNSAKPVVLRKISFSVRTGH